MYKYYVYKSDTKVYTDIHNCDLGATGIPRTL